MTQILLIGQLKPTSEEFRNCCGGTPTRRSRVGRVKSYLSFMVKVEYDLQSTYCIVWFLLLEAKNMGILVNFTACWWSQSTWGVEGFTYWMFQIEMERGTGWFASKEQVRLVNEVVVSETAQWRRNSIAWSTWGLRFWRLGKLLKNVPRCPKRNGSITTSRRRSGFRVGCPVSVSINSFFATSQVGAKIAGTFQTRRFFFHRSKHVSRWWRDPRQTWHPSPYSLTLGDCVFGANTLHLMWKKQLETKSIGFPETKTVKKKTLKNHGCPEICKNSQKANQRTWIISPRLTFWSWAVVAVLAHWLPHSSGKDAWLWW